MPLVHMKHGRLNAERGQRFHAANPQHDFLAHPHLEVAAVKFGSNQSVLGAVFRNIAIEKVETY